ncbi:hypothetical protein G6011_09094 [Alternaria panax]|uniref:SET domain-containing protein n=1 Tax=Alternaria panax TaxID=48097 RepID=A0AAD4IAE9_9PLEO|nr:hypothetical protein G6011_09094 [Alternaria panax]
MPSLYEPRPLPGKGNGLVASVNIPKGTRILCEKPIFTLASRADKLDSAVLMRVKALSKNQQRQYLSLHNNYPAGNIFSGIFRTNSLPCGPESEVGGVWNDMTNSETIHAVRDIKPGEEITIDYIKSEAFEARRTHLRDSFGFDCDCSLCSLPPSERQDSDARRALIERLDKQIGNSARVMNTPVCVAPQTEHQLVV